jgi:hypothetical protein
MIGPPNRRTTSSSRKLIMSFINDERLQLTGQTYTMSTPI